MRSMTKKSTTLLNLTAVVVLVTLLYLLEINKNSFGMAVSILQKSVILSIVAVSMNLLNGFTGLFSLGQAGFMAIGAYITAIFSISSDTIDSVYYTSGLAPWLMSFKLGLDVFPSAIRILFGLLLGGVVAGLFAALIGIPVLRLKSDYLAIATLGFSEIIRAILSSPQMDQITNGSYGLKNIPGFAIESDFLPVGTGSLLVPFAIAALCITFMVMLIKSSYGRAFMAIREDGVAAEAMGINLLKHKELSFIVSSFMTAIAGGLLAMFMRSIDARTFQISMTYDILLIVVIGGLGSITGSILSAFLVTASKEWWLRFFDQPLITGGITIPLFRTGFRMVVFSVLLMVVVLFFRRGLMGNREFSWSALLSWPKRMPKAKKGANKRG
ncbi:MAG: branched-chain amino acid ABC transporter permease [Eubacteriales bacterium]|nr:branched-chain amino acid ABC transporter permease [Eubacteriales bacterium]